MRIRLKGFGKLFLSGKGVARARLTPGERRRLARMLRREIRQSVRAMQPGFRRVVRNELTSQRFAAFLRDTLQGNTAVREIARQLINQAAAVTTTAGTVSGTVTEVGDDYVAIRETPATIVIVRLNQAVAVNPL